MRLLLRFLSPVLGLAVAAVGFLLALETIVAWTGSSPLVVPWTTWRTGIDAVTWSSGSVRTVAIVVGVVGLVVLLVALAARRRDVPLTDPVPEVSVTTSRRSLARAVGHEVRGAPDVVSASVAATGGKLVVKATTLDDPGSVRTSVRRRVDEAVGRLPLARRPRVSVSVSVTRGVK